MQRGAISLAYEGGHPSHLLTVLPVLRQWSLKATFFVVPTRLLAAPKAWKQASRDGHEVANGTLLESALPDGSLPAFTVESLLADVSDCEELLDEVIGKKPRSLALPIGKDECAEGPYANIFLEHYAVVRTGQVGVNPPGRPVHHGLLTLSCHGVRADQIVEAVRDAIRQGSWLVLSIGDVSETGMTPEDHATLLQYLGSSVDVADVAPITTVAAQRMAPTTSVDQAAPARVAPRKK